MSVADLKEAFKRRSMIIFTLVGIGLFALVILWISPKRFAETLESFSPRVLALTISLYAFSWFLRGTKFYLILRNQGYGIPLHKAVCISMIGGFANIFVMLQIGDITRIGIIKYLSGRDLGRSTSPILVDMSFGALGLLLSVIILLPFLGEGGHDWYFTVSIALGLLLLGIGVIYFLGEKIVKKLNKKEGKIRFLLSSLFSSLQEAFHNRKMYVVLLISMGAWFVEALSFSLLVPAPKILAMLAEMLGNVTKIVPITPGGVGTFSTAIATVISSVVGLSYKEILSYAVAFHMITKIVLAALGSFSLWAVKKGKESRTPSPEARISLLSSDTFPLSKNKGSFSQGKTTHFSVMNR